MMQAATTLNRHLSFRPDLQGLRAIAILLVVLAHAGIPLTPGGFVGVDVFFVLSGYLITGLLVKELQESDRINLARFYARRLRRLLPALVVMLCVTYAASAALLSAVEIRAQLASAPFAATWTSNIYFAFTAHGYFDELAQRDLFLHTWSLGVEEQFYLVWPLMLLGLYRLGRFLRINAKAGISSLGAGLVIAFLASLAASVYWTFAIPQVGFYLMPSRIWQFALGGMVFLAFFRTPAQPTRAVGRIGPALARFTLLIGLILVFGAAAALHPNMPYPGGWSLVPSIGAALIIAAGHGLRDGHAGPLAHPILVWLGDRSYSLYLWHWPIFALGFSLGVGDRLLPSVAMILFSLLAAIFSYRLVEYPFWKGQLSRAAPRRIALASVLVMIAVVSVLAQHLRQLPLPDTMADMSNQWRADVPAIYRMPCDAWYAHDRVEPCVFGKGSNERTVVLLGDSIGAQWFSMVPGIFSETDWRIVVLTKSSCAMVDEDYFYERIGQVFHICTRWRNAVLDTLADLKPDVIIVGSAATYAFSENSWVAGSSRVLDRLSNAAGSVFVIPGTPNLGFDGPGCVSRHLSPDGRISRNACLAEGRLRQVEHVTGSLREATRRFSNVRLLDLNDLVCPEGDCAAVSEDGLVVFRDSQHLTDSFVRARIPEIRERLERADQG